MNVLGQYYMTTAEEIAKHQALCALGNEQPLPNGSYDLIRALSGDDENLFSALWSFWNFEHGFDDLIDGCGWSKDMIEAAMQSLHDIVCIQLGYVSEHQEAVDFGELVKTLMRQCQWTEPRKRLYYEAQEGFFSNLRDNWLYRLNRGDFRALFTQCIFRALDGEAMASSDCPRRRQLAPAVKCGDLEVMYHLVYLAHGWTRARLASSTRDYDQPDMKEVK